MHRMDLADQPLPERQRLGVRVVDPEDPHAPLDPDLEDALPLVPQRGASVGIGALEVDRVDVLVLLRRVLGVLDRAVGRVAEPLGVLAHVRVVGRGLERDVHRQLHAVRLDLAAKVEELLQPAQLGRDRVVAAFRGADGVRRPDVVRRRVERVVAALAVGAADGMHRQQVQHVEAHGRHLRDSPLRLGEGRGHGPARVTPLRAREELVPGAESGALAVHHQRQLGRARREAAVGVAAHGGQQLLAQQRGGAGGIGATATQGGERPAHEERIVGGLGFLGPQQRGLGQQPALFQLDRDRNRRLELLAQAVAPRPELVAPGHDRVGVAAVAAKLEVAGPAIVVDRPHRRTLPVGLVISAQHELGVEQAVPVGVDVGGDEKLIANDALDREPAAIDGRGDPLDDDAPARADVVRSRLDGIPRLEHGSRGAAHALPGGGHGWPHPTRSRAVGAATDSESQLRPMPSLRRCAALALICPLTAACATPSPTTTEQAPPPPTSSGSAASVTADPRPIPAPDTTPSAAPTLPPVAANPPPLALEEVAAGLADPIGITTGPRGWLLVTEQAGRVVAIHPERGERAAVVDRGDRILAGGERGLLGLALHPDWPEVGRAFVHYTASDTDAVLAELGGGQQGEGPPTLDASSERILLELPDPFPNHNGGQLAFGPDGYLYVGLGDGGAGDDPLNHGQDTSSVLGSILRLDVSQPGRHAIPPDNPFVDGGGAPEIFLYGLRNPWRFSFDPATGLLWIADVGQSAFEEVNRVDPVADAGANLGWNLMEGAHCFADASCSSDGLILPLAEYGRDAGCSVTGGHVYRGTAIEGLAGWYLFADYCSGLLFGIASDATAPPGGTALLPRILLETGAAVSSFGVDSDGELYLVDHIGGVLSRIVAAGG